VQPIDEVVISSAKKEYQRYHKSWPSLLSFFLLTRIIFLMAFPASEVDVHTIITIIMMFSIIDSEYLNKISYSYLIRIPNQDT